MIRKIERAELPSCADMIRAAFADVAAEFELTPENAPTNPAFITLARLEEEYSDGCDMYGAFIDGELAGFMQLYVSGEKCALEKLCVLSEYRHSGIGALLIKTARDIAATAGAKRILIGIINENARLKNWYIKNGFAFDGAQKFPHLPFEVGFMSMEL